MPKKELMRRKILHSYRQKFLNKRNCTVDEMISVSIVPKHLSIAVFYLFIGTIGPQPSLSSNIN